VGRVVCGAECKPVVTGCDCSAECVMAGAILSDDPPAQALPCRDV
jgi:hypothetical protein